MGHRLNKWIKWAVVVWHFDIHSRRIQKFQAESRVTGHCCDERCTQNVRFVASVSFDLSVWCKKNICKIHNTQHIYIYFDNFADVFFFVLSNATNNNAWRTLITIYLFILFVWNSGKFYSRAPFHVISFRLDTYTHNISAEHKKKKTKIPTKWQFGGIYIYILHVSVCSRFDGREQKTETRKDHK